MLRRVGFLLAVVTLLAIPRTAFADFVHMPIPGGMYSDALPNARRDWATLIPFQHIETSRGVVPLPAASGMGVLYLRICDAGAELWIAGQVHSGPLQDHAIEWAGGHWRDRGVVFAVSPVAYGPGCDLKLARPGTGSQGIRFIDQQGRVWTGDETYGSGEPWRLAEWTAFSDKVRIGQSYTANDAPIVVYPGGRAMLMSLSSRFIHGAEAFGTYAAAMWTVSDPRNGHLFWFTLQDLETRPREPAASTTPPPPSPPSTPPPPPATREFPDRERTLIAERQKHGARLSHAQAGDVLNRVAWAHRTEGFGLLRKDGGNNCPVDGLVERVSCDWIVHLPSGTGCDVFDDGPGVDPQTGERVAGRAGPKWCREGEPFDVSRFLSPVPPKGQTDPGPTPTPPDPRIAELEKRLAERERRIAELEAALSQTQGDAAHATRRVRELEAERDELKRQLETDRAALAEARAGIERLKARPCRAKVPGWLRALGVRVRCEIPDQ